MARFAPSKIEDIRTRADIVEVVGTHVGLKRAGRNFVGLCPFHNEKTPSFTVNPERGFFHCFGCGAGGTVFDFVMRVEGLNFPEALQSLARRYGITLPEPAGSGGLAVSERDALARANQTAAEFYAHVLWNTQDGAVARDYLKSRGIILETARAFMVGFAPSRPANLSINLRKRELLDAALKLGLVRKDEGGATYDMFRARLMFPIRDVQGRVIGFGGRVLDNRLPKYINSPESPLYSKARALYGLFEARQAIAKTDRAILVEGYLDAISLWQAGFKETVASLGTSLTAEQLRLVSRYTRNAIACFDGDEAGRKASLRALEVFLHAGLLGRGVFIPQGHDPDTLVRDRGAQALSDLLDTAELLVDYFLRQQAQNARESVGARARAAERVADLLGMVTNPFEFDILARKAAGALGVGEEVIRKEARRNRGGLQRQNGSAALPVKIPRPAAGLAQAEIGLIAIALRHPELRSEITAAAPAVSSDDAMAGLLKELCASEESQATLEVLVVARLREDQRSQLSALLVRPEDDPQKARAIAEDYIAAMSGAGLRRNVEEEVRRAALTMRPDEAIEAAQRVIALRRRPER